VGWFPGAMLGTIESLNALARFKSRLVEFVKREPARLQGLKTCADNVAGHALVRGLCFGSLLSGTCDRLRCVASVAIVAYREPASIRVVSA
jgi:hypothetical protein